MPPSPSPWYARAAGTSLLIDPDGPGLPRVLHWGRDLGPLDDADLAAVAAVALPPVPTNVMDEPVPLTLLPEASAGWAGTPGLTAHRDGRAFSTAFAVTTTHTAGQDDGTSTLVVDATDTAAGIELRLEAALLPSGLVRQHAVVTNRGVGTGGGGPLEVQSLLLGLPLPPWATEILDLTGRHQRERSPQRHRFTHGTHARENRRGRTGTDASLLLVAGAEGFGFGHGQVWGLHVAWSGNHRELAEALPSNQRMLAGGELLLPGEIRLQPGESYRSPDVYAGHGDGLDALAHRFHRFLRDRPHHPTTPRPVTLNTWEAVYFGHDLDRLTQLAERAARVGVERFVLDDGWFLGRRNDRAGLGDWTVDPAVWPDGLHPLIERVRGLGMEFGLWVEPEMVNPDSELARAHPDWILQPEGRMPPLSRHQQVLDLARPEVADHLLRRLDALLSEYPIGYLKWDHNRDLVDAGDATGRPGVHAQTQAVYALLDELRRRHESVEIESCSSGGGRVDLAILERTDRVWASDCIDPLERQQIQRWTQQLLPPELVGAHVGSPVSHTTGREHPLDLRAAVAVFGHLGIEWDLTTATDDDLARLSEWIEVHRRLRPLLHTGTVVRGDHPDEAVWVHGVVAADRRHAVHAIAQRATSVGAPPGPVRLPGLRPDARYRLRPLPPGDRVDGPGVRDLPWWGRDDLVLPGRVLTETGVQAPLSFPERVVLVESRQVG